MDRKEAILTLRKNKLDMEHQELLQDRNVIVLTEIGTPITLINVAVTAQIALSHLTTIVFVGLVFTAIVEWARRHNKKHIINKRNEIDLFIRQLQSEEH